MALGGDRCRRRYRDGLCLKEKINMPESLEEIRNRLIMESSAQPEEWRPGYVNGILDFYSQAKRKEEALNAPQEKKGVIV